MKTFHNQDYYNEKLMHFIEKNPCNFFVIKGQSEELKKSEYTQLNEGEAWNLIPGGKYFTTRNGSSLIAFRIPEQATIQKPSGFMMFASHSDSPTFRVKTNPEIHPGKGYTTLNIELYGGAILNSWLDRPLSVAGRIMVVKDDRGVKTQLVKVDKDLLLIPNLAIHMNRQVSEEHKLNIQKELLPLFGNEKANFMQVVADEANVSYEDIISHELVLYLREKPSMWGANQEFLSAPRLDDVQASFASLQGFLESEDNPAEKSIPLHIVFDNEEVGSGTKQGACSTFLKDTMRRITDALGMDGQERRQMIAHSLMISGDNGHALHPNYLEKCDPTNQVCLGDGIYIKHAANQKYTTDAVSEALIRMLAKKADVPVKDFFNRSDMQGGSTLGNLSGQQVAVVTVDVGVPQLAMHSCYETCSAKDTQRLVALAKQLFESSLHQTKPGDYQFEW